MTLIFVYSLSMSHFGNMRVPQYMPSNRQRFFRESEKEYAWNQLKFPTVISKNDIEWLHIEEELFAWDAVTLVSMANALFKHFYISMFRRQHMILPKYFFASLLAHKHNLKSKHSKRLNFLTMHRRYFGTKYEVENATQHKKMLNAFLSKKSFAARLRMCKIM